MTLDPDSRAEGVERDAEEAAPEHGAAPAVDAGSAPPAGGARVDHDVEVEPGEAAPEAPGDGAAVELERYVDALQRLKADFDNYRKRSERERLAVGLRSTRELVGDLLPVMDNLERAVTALGDQDPSVVAGVEMVRAQLHGLLLTRGVQEIDARGAVFDPNVHEAILSQPSADHAAGTVVEVIQKGYRLDEVVVRPARVIVAAAL